MSLLVLPFVLVACTQTTSVKVAETTSDKTAVFPHQILQLQATENLPENVTAICRDGSYSMAQDESKCASNGGVRTIISRYSAKY
ncbi:hypothetical protein A6A10_06175 [Otariodibacter oris]|nr:hypothetical protein A6A10_06175 [Otariodibacter oris]